MMRLQESCRLPRKNFRTRRGAASRAVGFSAAAFGGFLFVGFTAEALAASEDGRQPAVRTECKAELPSEMLIRAAIEPRLIIDEDCVDPYFNADNFAV